MGNPLGAAARQRARRAAALVAATLVAHLGAPGLALRASAQPTGAQPPPAEVGSRSEPDPRLASLAPVVGAPSAELVDDAQDTVLDVAHRHRLGYDRVVRVNPGINVWIPDPGAVIRLPTEHVLPEKPWKGLVINIPEMQLYDFTVERPDGEPDVYAIAIGDQMDPSLIGSFKIGRKREQPAWHVPKSILAERPELPPVVPPGPDNPLGPFWMTIGSTSYGIHGSNNEWSIGREATHGCIRLYNDEIERLYARTKPGTPIRLDYQTVKLGQRGRTLYVESHPDVYQREADRMERAVERLRTLDLLRFVDVSALLRAIAEERGAPIPLATLPSPDVPGPLEPDAGPPLADDPARPAPGGAPAPPLRSPRI